MEGLVPGRIVYFVFGPQDAEQVNRRRTNVRSIADRIQTETWPIGAQAHIGNDVREGDIVPAMVLRVWSPDGNVNLKVMLDGSDTYWATSVGYAEAIPGSLKVRSWHWMFDGQDKRYTPDVAKTS